MYISQRWSTRHVRHAKSTFEMERHNDWELLSEIIALQKYDT